jgi:hypothetical protein
MSDVYVFLGPSLPVSEAREDLDAVYLPPAVAGDVYRLWQSRPRAIGIVDGYFEHAPAVWHKEIMSMMEHGVHVFGAAGMGALRAAELDSFGMHGVGKVYTSFRDGLLERDDEVAVALGDDKTGRPLSVSMVNIRATLGSARENQVVSAATEETLLKAGVAMFYQHRTWPSLVDSALGLGADVCEVDALRRWLPVGYVDQQAEDAAAMLYEIRAFLATDPGRQCVRWSVASTERWATAMRRIDARSEQEAGSDSPARAQLRGRIR